MSSASNPILETGFAVNAFGTRTIRKRKLPRVYLARS